MQNIVPAIQRPFAALLAFAGVMTLAPAALQGALTYYTTRSSFDAAEPGLPVEDFDPIFSPAVIPAPLSSTTNNFAFSPGNILPGIVISNKNPALSAQGLYVAGGAVAPNYFEDPLVLSFAPGVSAVGLDIYSSNGGTLLGGSFTADIYNGPALLGSRTLSEPASVFFIGFSSTALMTSVIITYNQTEFDGTPFVDNIAFGTVAASAPEPSTAALCALAAVFFFSRVASNRRRVRAG